MYGAHRLGPAVATIRVREVDADNGKGEFLHGRCLPMLDARANAIPVDRWARSAAEAVNG